MSLSLWYHHFCDFLLFFYVFCEHLSMYIYGVYTQLCYVCITPVPDLLIPRNVHQNFIILTFLIVSMIKISHYNDPTLM